MLTQRFVGIRVGSVRFFGIASSDSSGLPKRPINGYIRFVNESRSDLMARQPSLKVVDVIKQLSSVWAELPEERRKKYNDAYEADMAAYKQKIESMKMSTDPKIVELMAKKKEEVVTKQLKKAAKNKKQLLTELGKPKRPGGSNILFMQDQFEATKKANSGWTSMQIMEAIATKWKSLGEQEKAVYQSRAEKARADYNVALEEWQKRMEKSDKMEEIVKAQEKLKRIRKKKNHLLLD